MPGPSEIPQSRGCLFYYITDRTAFSTNETTRRFRLLEKIAEAARAGVDYIQIREKDLTARELELLSADAVGILNGLRSTEPRPRTKLLINSRIDVALAVGADGIHLRSTDVSPVDVQAAWQECDVLVLPKVPVIGVSCHSADEVKNAELSGASFAVFAPVFEKKDAPASRPAGLLQLQEACKAKIPVLALGGITLENAKQCLKAGASGIAAIRLFQENNIRDIVAMVQSTSASP